MRARPAATPSAATMNIAVVPAQVPATATRANPSPRVLAPNIYPDLPQRHREAAKHAQTSIVLQTSTGRAHVA